MSKPLSAMERLRGLLGLSQRAGRLVTGMDTTLSAIRSGKTALVLLDEDAAENTLKKVKDACIYYHAPIMYLPKGLLEEACGRDGRMTGALTDRGFAKKAQDLMAENEKEISFNA